jgi:hypothetical protein
MATHIRRQRRSVRSCVKDTLPEWSRGADSSSPGASCVSSNSTGVNISCCFCIIAIYVSFAHWKLGGVHPTRRAFLRTMLRSWRRHAFPNAILRSRLAAHSTYRIRPRVLQDIVSERLRTWTRNPLGSARRGPSPLGVDLRSCMLCVHPSEFCKQHVDCAKSRTRNQHSRTTENIHI